MKRFPMSSSFRSRVLHQHSRWPTPTPPRFTETTVMGSKYTRTHASIWHPFRPTIHTSEQSPVQHNRKMENKTTTAQKKNNLRNVDEFETFNLIQVPLMDGIVRLAN